MSKRPPNEIESRLHQAALASSKKEITAKQAESIIPDATARQNALNFLLGVGLLKGMTASSGQVSFRAVTKEEIVATKGLNDEENLVLSHIKSSANEGIWTKHLKAKTSLHQTVIDRCLKTLTQKRLIKRVPSVQHITRKIYMLEGIEPSIALTGGPWYTDNELDTEFIQNLTEACYKLISDISFPKRRNGSSEGALYPISNAPRYPTADNIRHSLRKARLTETDLSVEHVEMLLNVLVLDGKIEKIPAFGSALWNSESIQTDEENSSNEEKSSKRRKRKKRSDESDDDLNSRRKRKKHTVSDEESDSSDAGASRKKSKKRRVKEDSEPGSESDSEEKNIKKGKKKYASSNEENPSDDEGSRRKKSKKKKIENTSESESESSSERRRKKSKSKPKSLKRSVSPVMEFDIDTGSGGSVYRALKGLNTGMGWSESPCAICPSFEFCKENGPVNPQECVYYGEWLAGRTMANEEETT